MSSLNKAILIGRLGADPEIRYTPDGKAIANFTLATSERWKDKNTGEWQEKAEWHRLSAFARLAEVIGEHLKKGSKIYVEGRLETRKWTDRQNIERYTTGIIIKEMKMLDSRPNQDGDQDQSPPDDFDDSDIPF